MLASMVFWKIKLGDLSRPRIDYLRAIAGAPIDFDSLTPDQERNVADGEGQNSQHRLQRIKNMGSRFPATGWMALRRGV
jgi:hypothetical protein